MVVQRGDGLQRCVAGNADAHAGIALAEAAQHGKQEAVQRIFADGDGHDALLHGPVERELAPSGLHMRVRSFNVGKEFFAFRRERHAAVGADEERAAERLLQLVMVRVTFGWLL